MNSQSAAPDVGRRRLPVRLAAGLAAACLAFGGVSCSPDSPSDPGETQGRIAVEVSSAGTGIPASYTVRLDGASPRSVAADGATEYTALAAGNYEVALSVPTNCAVSGGATRTVGVQEGVTSTVTYSVTCTAVPIGAVEVSVTTTGQNLDPDGYTVDLDGVATRSVGVNGTTVFTSVVEGAHALTLQGIAPNCSVNGPNPVSATVSGGQTTDVSFEVACSATVGDLQVSATTSGSQVDPDGYSVRVDAGTPQSLGVNGSVNFAGLAPGSHDVELSGVEGNCSVAGENPRSVDVSAGATASTSFEVTCSSTVGLVEVSVATSGQAIDADGYSVVLDGGASTQLVDPDDTVTFGGLAPGSHSFELQNVAANCSVTSPNPASVTVTAGATANLAFTVTCAQLEGAIEVNMSTTGSEPDPNGYTVLLDGGSARSVGINGSRVYTDVVVGEHQIEITGVAVNCAVQGDNPRTVTVTEGATTQVNVSVVCSATTGQIQVTATTSGEDVDPNGYTIFLDGSSSRSIPSNGSTTFTGVTPGSHTLQLANEEDNCTVTSANPTSVNVTAGATANASFTVSCVGLTGDLEVTTSTSGEDVDDGYFLVVDGGAPSPIGSDQTVVFPDVDDGDHTVQLTGIAGNCSLSSGSNPRTVNVPPNLTGSTTFAIVCVGLTGDLQVSTATTGDDLDNAYTLSVDGAPAVPIGANDILTFPDVDDGDHTVLLDGIAGNCSLVSGTNPRVVNVPANGTGPTTFAISCVGLTGDLEVTTATTGPDADDAYQISIDGGPGQAIGANETITLFGLDDGLREIELLDVAGNCTVGGSNPRDVNVPAGGMASTTFSVTCTATTGSIDVDVSTSGPEPDPDGYIVTLDGGSGMAVGVNGSVSFPGLAPGSYDIELTDIDGTCVVTETNPTTASVSIGATTDVTFTVTCPASPGNIRVTANTSGDDPDTSYDVTVGGSSLGSIAANGDTVTSGSLAPGDYEVVLGDVAGNCVAGGAGAIDTVTVSAGATTTKAFDVTCAMLTGAIEVTTSTTGDDVDGDGYSISVDGGGPVAIGTDATVTIGGVDDGDRSVTLAGLASNCSVTLPNPRTVTVAANDTTPTLFVITCTQITGSIEVRTATTGTGADLDGYLVDVDGGTPLSIAALDTVTFAGVPVGIRSVNLTDVEDGCSVVGSASVPTGVTNGATAGVDFTVDCP